MYLRLPSFRNSMQEVFRCYKKYNVIYIHVWTLFNTCFVIRMLDDHFYESAHAHKCIGNQIVANIQNRKSTDIFIDINYTSIAVRLCYHTLFNDTLETCNLRFSF